MNPSAFQFTNPILLDMKMEINRHFSPDENKAIETRFHFRVNKETQKREAIVELTVEIGGKETYLPFFISITEGAKFKWCETVDSKSDTLLNQNALALLLGYVRPLIATITAASPFGAYHIPFIDFTGTEKNSD